MISKLAGGLLAASLVAVSGFGSEDIVRNVLFVVACVGMFAALSAGIQIAMSNMYASSRDIALAKAAAEIKAALEKAMLSTASGLDATEWTRDAEAALRKARGNDDCTG